MASEGSVTRWLGLIQAGDAAAAQKLWERYFARLVGLARKRLADAPRAAADEEDVALSAFDTFCRKAEQGHFPQLLDRDGLWRLLVVITVRKAAHLVRDQGRKKRVAVSISAAESDDAQLLDLVISHEPTPDLAAQMAEECQLLLRQLGDRELQQVALWRMEGFSVEEIAEKLQCVSRSVKRKLRLIRSIWEKASTT
jgi:DNA-directed RNA polymerase specialized sigma24 family protein